MSFGTSTHTHSLLLLSFITIPFVASPSITVAPFGLAPSGFVFDVSTFVIVFPSDEPPFPPF